MPRTYNNSVFINCPFDPAYRPLFEAVTFAVYDCGFFPRCALEVEDGSQVRIEKITAIVGTSRLAIHDISRTQPDAETGLPRFNMPLELGIFLGAKSFGSNEQRLKAALILEEEQYRYQKYISDIAGQDIRPHHGESREAIRHVRNFLSTHCRPRVVLPGGEMIATRYGTFQSDLPTFCSRRQLDPGGLTFRDLTNLIVGWLEEYPLAVHPQKGRALPDLN